MNEPTRIQRKRTKGWRMPADVVYVGRPTKWANPFVVGIDGDREHCLHMYKQYTLTTLVYRFGLEYFEPLRGKTLACWCREDQACHADALLALLEKGSL